MQCQDEKEGQIQKLEPNKNNTCDHEASIQTIQLSIQPIEIYPHKQQLLGTTLQSQMVSLDSVQYDLKDFFYLFYLDESDVNHSQQHIYFKKDIHEQQQQFNSSQSQLERKVCEDEKQNQSAQEELIDDQNYYCVPEQGQSQLVKNQQPLIFSQGTKIAQADFPQPQQSLFKQELQKQHQKHPQSQTSQQQYSFLNQQINSFQLPVPSLSSSQPSHNSAQQISQQSQWSQQMGQFVIRQTVINDTVVVGFNSHFSKRLNRNHSSDYSFYSHEVQAVEDIKPETQLGKVIQFENIQKRTRNPQEWLTSFWEDQEALEFFYQLQEIVQNDSYWDHHQGNYDTCVEELSQNSIHDISQIVIQIMYHGYGEDIQLQVIDKVCSHLLEIYSQKAIIQKIYLTFKSYVRQQLPQNSYQDVKNLMKLAQHYMTINQFVHAAELYLTAINVAIHQHFLYNDKIKSILIDKCYKNLKIIGRAIKNNKQDVNIYIKYFKSAKKFQNQVKMIMNNQLKVVEENIDKLSRISIQAYLNAINEQPQDEIRQEQQQMQEHQLQNQHKSLTQLVNTQSDYFDSQNFKKDFYNDSIDSTKDIENQLQKLNFQKVQIQPFASKKTQKLKVTKVLSETYQNINLV